MKKKMTKKQLVEELKKLQNNRDAECVHINADALLLVYIDDNEVTEQFRALKKWYA